MATGNTVTTYYAGTSGGASGDSYVTLPQSVTEFVPAFLQAGAIPVKPRVFQAIPFMPRGRAA